jgi:hypothetical protein
VKVWSVGALDCPLVLSPQQRMDPLVLRPHENAMPVPTRWNVNGVVPAAACGTAVWLLELPPQQRIDPFRSRPHVWYSEAAT